MIYLLYKTTNTLNGKIYIGCHKTDNIEDGYLGSGTLLNKAIKKYGKENFTRVVLDTFDSAEDMFRNEAKIVNEDFVSRKDTYNMKVGGEGGFDYLNGGSGRNNSNKDKEAIYKKVSEKMKGRKPSDAARKAASQAHKDGRIRYDNFKGMSHSDVSKEKKRQAMLGKLTGSKNGSFGTRWITNGTENKKIPKGNDIPPGWVAGRKMNSARGETL